MMPTSIPWWAWLLIAALCWFLQLMMSIQTDSGSLRAWTIRIALIVGMALSALIAVIRFVKWVWQG